MALKDFFTRRRDPAQRRTRDWTRTLTSRDWADLPVYHPRREEDAL